MIKNFLRLTVIGFAILYGIYATYIGGVTLYKMNHDHLECGTVIARMSDEVTIKHGVDTQLILVIDWENKPTDDIEVSPTTYYTSKVGNRICFKEDDYVPAHDFVNGFTEMIGLGIVILGPIVLLFVGLIILFTKDEGERRSF